MDKFSQTGNPSNGVNQIAQTTKKHTTMFLTTGYRSSDGFRLSITA